MDWFVSRYESLGAVWHIYRRRLMQKGEGPPHQPTAHRIRTPIPDRIAKPGDLVYYRRAFYEWFQGRLGRDPADYSQDRLAEGVYTVLDTRGTTEDGWWYELEPNEFVSTMYCRRWRGDEQDAEPNSGVDRNP